MRLSSVHQRMRRAQPRAARCTRKKQCTGRTSNHMPSGNYGDGSQPCTARYLHSGAQVDGRAHATVQQRAFRATNPDNPKTRSRTNTREVHRHTGKGGGANTPTVKALAKIRNAFNSLITRAAGRRAESRVVGEERRPLIERQRQASPREAVARQKIGTIES